MIHREARQGLSSASQPLPHAERIQAAFGHHDVSEVRVGVGGAAKTASERMGALAFASGHRIGFRDTPDLRLAAHEAAHVVQQREGLSLPGNVGKAGDRWERHADQVADAVVEGRSAEPLLNQVSGSPAEAHGAGAPAVQRQLTSRASRLLEPPPVLPEVPTSRGEGEAGAAEARGEASEPASAGAEGSAIEEAGAGDSEPPPEGVSAGGASPSASPGGAAPGGGATPAAPGGGISAPCYNVDPPPRPENAPEPGSDPRGAQPQQQSSVTFEAWAEELEACPAEEAMAEGSQQLPAGMGQGASAPGGASTSAGPEAAAPESAESGPPAGEAVATGPEGGASESSEVRAMSSAATTEEHRSEAAADALGGQLSSAESQRDAAVADYESSTAGLAEVLGRAQRLRHEVSFASTGERGEAAVAREAAAIAQVRDFMEGAVGQIAEAVAFARLQVPARLGGMAEATKANIAGAMELEKATISDRLAQARELAMGEAQASRAHVLSEYEANVALVDAETATAIAALDTQHTTSLDQVDEKETTGLDGVNSRFATGRTQHEAKGPEYATRATARGQEHAHQYERCKRGYGDDGFWDGCLTVRRAKAQQDAACETAKGYKDAFLRTANKKGYDLKELRKRFRCAVISGARQVGQTLDDVHGQLVSGLETGRTRVLEGLRLARTQNLAAIDQALGATLRTLAAQEATQRQAINDTGYMKQLAVEQVAHASAAGLGRGIAAAASSLEQVLTGLRANMARGEAPDAAALALMLGNLQGALSGGMGTLLGGMEAGAGDAEARLAEAGEVALEALTGITRANGELAAQVESGYASQMGGLRAGASAALGQLARAHVRQAQQSATQGTASMQQAVAGFDQAVTSIYGNVDTAIATSLQELDQELTGKLGELDGQIAREAWKAAEKEQPAWKSVVAVLLVILVVIAAAAISIVTLGAGASLFAVILVGALVGAVSGGLIQVINNWASGEELGHGVVQAMVMGAIGGAIGGGLGFAAGAVSAAAGPVTQFAANLGADLVSEGLTQAIGYAAFGQQISWQGFLMAGTMSAVSFRPRTGGPRVGAPDVSTPHAGAPATPHTSAATPHAGGRPAGTGGGTRAAVAQIGGGALAGFAVEGFGAWIRGEKFDLTRAASSAVSGAVSARASRMSHGAAPAPEPTTRAGRALEAFRGFDPGGVGARIEQGLGRLGRRTFSVRPDAELPPGSRLSSDAPGRRPLEETEPGRTRGVEEPTPARPREEADVGGRPSEAESARRVSDTESADATPELARAMSGPARFSNGMTYSGQEVRTDFVKDLSVRAQRAIRVLEARGSVSLREIPTADLAAISRWFSREIGVVQTPVGRLRLILGTETGILTQQIKPGEVFLVHTHPTFSSQSSHLSGTDIPKASPRIEAVVDWSGLVIYFSSTRGVINPADRFGNLQPMPKVRAAFMNSSGTSIVGYGNIEVTSTSHTTLVKVVE